MKYLDLFYNYSIILLICKFIIAFAILIYKKGELIVMRKYAWFGKKTLSAAIATLVITGSVAVSGSTVFANEAVPYWNAPGAGVYLNDAGFLVNADGMYVVFDPAAGQWVLTFVPVAATYQPREVVVQEPTETVVRRRTLRNQRPRHRMVRRRHTATIVPAPANLPIWVPPGHHPPTTTPPSIVAPN